MNLKQIREYVERMSDYQPRTDNYRTFLDQTIRDAYLRIWGEQDWTFAERRGFVRLQTAFDSTAALQDLASLSITPSGDSVTLTTLPNSRAVLASDVIPRLYHPRNIWQWIGQELRIGDEVRRIIWIEAGTSNDIIWTDSPFRRGAVENDWEIIPRYIWLEDEVEAVTDATLRSTPYRDAPQVKYNLEVVDDQYFRRFYVDDANSASNPSFFTLQPPVLIPPAGKMAATSLEGTGGNLTAGLTYEFAWAYTAPGRRYGPLSEPVEYTVGQGNDGVRLSFLNEDGSNAVSYSEATISGYPYGSERDYSKTVFVNANVDRTTGVRLGEPKWMAVPFGATVLPADIGSTVTDGQLNAANVVFQPSTINIVNEDWIEARMAAEVWEDTSGILRSAAVYPYTDTGHYLPGARTVLDGETIITTPPDNLQEIDVAWRRIPPPLNTDRDTPGLPPDMRHVLTDMVMCDVCMRNNDETKAEMYRRRYENGIEKARKRYAFRPGAVYAKTPAGAGDRWTSVWAATVQSYIAKNRS